jgi:hypothetical protein
VPDDEDEDGGFFDTFATRWKNTFESTDFSFKRPQWLGGDNEVEAGRSRRPADRGEERSSGFLGLFAGRGDEGRVRL